MASFTTFIPSAQVVADGQPRFQVPTMPEHPGWSAAAAEEEAGGVSAEVRTFLDAQLGSGDVVIDLAPGFGFVALSATTAPGGMPTVFVAGLDDDRMQVLQDAAVDAGGWLDALPADALPELASYATSRLEPDGRVIVHCEPSQLAQLSEWLAPLLADHRVLAICLSGAATVADWSAVESLLTGMGFSACAIVDKDGELMVVRSVGTPTADVIALPQSLLDDDGDAGADGSNGAP